jgi:ATP-dependent Clp protease protease subunit
MIKGVAGLAGMGDVNRQAPVSGETVELTQEELQATIDEVLARVKNEEGDSDKMTPRKLTLWGEITGANTKSIIQDLITLSWESEEEPIEIWICSPGGGLGFAYALYDTMMAVPCPVHTVGLGYVYSAATLILTAGEKGGRFLMPNTRVMMHAIQYSDIGGWNSQPELAVIAEEGKSQQKILVDLMSKHSKMSVGEVQALMNRNMDKYLSANQAIKLGLADKLIRPDRAKVVKK